MKSGPDPKEIQHFQFKQSTTRQVCDFITNPPSAGALIATDCKRGLIYVAHENKITVLPCSENSQPGQKLVHTLSAPISRISLSCDYTYLAVTYNSSKAHIYNAASTCRNSLELLHEIQFSRSPQPVYAYDLKWNPAIPGSFCTIASDSSIGSFSLKAEQKSTVTILALERIQGLEPTCIAWSPKGKQIVVGCRNGSIVQLKPELKVARSLPGPEPSIGEALAMTWLSNYQFCVAYSDNTERRINVVIVDAPKGETKATFTNYEDITFGMPPADGIYSPCYYLEHIPEWNIIIAASSCSSEVALLGSPDAGVNWEQWQLIDSGRAELPLIKETETYPLGISIDKTPQTLLPWVDERSLPHPVPILHIFGNSGKISSFHVVNLTPNCPTLCSAPWEPVTLAIQAASPQPVPQESTNRTSLLPSEISFALNSAATSTPRPKATEVPAPRPQDVPTSNLFGEKLKSPLSAPPGTGQLGGSQGSTLPTPFGATQGAPSGTPFGTTQGTSTAFGTKQGNLFGTAQGAPTATPFGNTQAPVMGNAFGTAQGSPLGGSQGNTLGKSLGGGLGTALGTSQGAAPGALFGTVTGASSSGTALGSSLGTALGTSSQVVPQQPTVQASIPQPAITIPKPKTDSSSVPKSDARPLQVKEVPAKPVLDENVCLRLFHDESTSFEKELKKILEPIDSHCGTDEEKQKLVVQSGQVEDFLTELKEATKSLESDIAYLNALLFQSFAWIEETKSRNSTEENNKRHDSSKVKELQKMYLNAQSQLIQATKALDMEWTEYQSRQKTKMKIPSLEFVYQSLKRHSEIIAKEKAIVEAQTKKWKLLSKSSKVPSLNRSMSKLSLGKSSLPINGEGNRTLELRCESIANNARSFSREKQMMLRDVLMHTKTRVIKTANPTPVQDRLEATLSSLAAMSPVPTAQKPKPAKSTPASESSNSFTLGSISTSQSVSKSSQLPGKTTSFTSNPASTVVPTSTPQVPKSAAPASPLASLNSIVAGIGIDNSKSTPNAMMTQPLQFSLGSSFSSQGFGVGATDKLSFGSNLQVNKSPQSAPALNSILSKGLPPLGSWEQKSSESVVTSTTNESVPISSPSFGTKTSSQSATGIFKPTNVTQADTLTSTSSILPSNLSIQFKDTKPATTQSTLSLGNPSIFSGLTSTSPAGTSSNKGALDLSNSDSGVSDKKPSEGPASSMFGLGLSPSTISFGGTSMNVVITSTTTSPSSPVTTVAQLAKTINSLPSGITIEKITATTSAPSLFASNPSLKSSIFGSQSATTTAPNTATIFGSTTVTPLGQSTSLQATSLASSTPSSPTVSSSEKTVTTSAPTLSSVTPSSPPKTPITTTPSGLGALSSFSSVLDNGLMTLNFGEAPSSSGNSASSASATSIFGKSSISPASSTSSIFGPAAPATTASGSIFGGSATATTTTTTTTTTSIFGAAAASTTTASIFGQTAKTTTTGSIFGQIFPAITVTTTASTSEQTAPSTNTTTASIFGQTTTTTASIFGQTTPATTTASIFGQATTPVTTSAASIFSQAAATTTASIFGQPAAATTSSSPFGQQSAATMSSSPFGQPSAAATMSSSPFGQSSAAATTSSSPFGQSGSTASGSIFGQASTTSTSASIFGQPAATTTASIFGGAAAAPATSTSNVFGSPAANNAPQGSIFGGLSAPSSGSMFGGGATSAQPEGGSPFGGSSFGSSSSPSLFGGAPATAKPASGSIFGGAPTFGMGAGTAATSPTPAFGGSPAFGSKPVFGAMQPVFGAPKPEFGSSPAFGAQPSFGSPGGFGSTPAMGAAPGMPSKVFGSPGNSTFESLAGQNGGIDFGSLAQKSPEKPPPPTFSGGSSFSNWR